MSLRISRQLDFSEIPLIDLRPFIDGSYNQNNKLEFLRACSDVGFIYISNHGIDPELIETLHELSKLFFNQPMESKRQITINQQIRGYLPLYYKSYEGEAREGISHQQGFWIGHETPLDTKRPLDGPNQWPENPRELKPVMLDYFSAVEQLSTVLLRSFALALDLELNCFDSLFERPTSRLKLNHYPIQDNPQTENNIGVVPHTDSGGFTILWQDQHGGLEIQNRQGDWVAAPPVENTFVVNLGNIMQIWSNGLFPATTHRVINRGNAERYSIPLFVNPDHSARIKPLTRHSSEELKAFKYGDYQLELWRRTFPVAGISQK